jgi:chromosomal replication initiator protein
MVVAHRLCRRSFPRLGRAFGGRDHTTILAAVRKADHHAGLQEAIAKLMAAIEQAFPSAPSQEEGEGTR